MIKIAASCSFSRSLDIRIHKPYYKDTKKMVPVQHFRDVLFLLSKEEEDTVTFFRKRHSE